MRPTWCRSPALVFRDRRGMSSGFLSHIMALGPHLVLRVPDEESAEYPKEVGALDPELVLREIPGKSVERSPHPQRLRRRLRSCARLHPPRGEVVRVGLAPLRLGLCAAPQFALRRGTRALPVSDTRVRQKPLPTEATRPTAQRAHARPSRTTRGPTAPEPPVAAPRRANCRAARSPRSSQVVHFS